MKKVRLIDVAEHAGVSKSTVSQYLNGRYDYMSASTKTSIEAAIKALNYVPNPIARSLKTDKTKTIGVIVRDVTGFYTSRAIRGIDDFCKRQGYNVLIYNTDFDAEVESKALSALSQLCVDGLIMASTGKNADAIAQSIERGTPVVEFQLEHDDTPKSVVVSDYRQATYEATDYLAKLGHRRICFLTQKFKTVKSRNDRFEGYQAALADNGIALDERLVVQWHRQTQFETDTAALLAMAEPPTAFFSQHLAITTDLLESLSAAHIQIPEQASVISFDDLPMAEFFKVPVTAIKQRPYDIGEQAANLLLQHIKDKKQEVQRVIVPHELVIRESCKRI